MKMMLCLLAVVMAWVVLVYNRLIRKRNDVANARAQIEVQLTRRYELIPNIVAVAQRYMVHEQAVFAEVSRARAQALDVPFRLMSERQVQSVQGQLVRALQQFFVCVESYPALKADEQMRALQEELRSTENRVAFARQYFNDVVTDYNDALQVFPDRIIGSMFGFRVQALLDLPIVPVSAVGLVS